MPGPTPQTQNFETQSARLAHLSKRPRRYGCIVTALLATSMISLFLLAMMQSDQFKAISPAQWMPIGIAIVGVTFAAILLV